MIFPLQRAFSNSCILSPKIHTQESTFAGIGNNVLGMARELETERFQADTPMAGTIEQFSTFPSSAITSNKKIKKQKDKKKTDSSHNSFS